MGLCPFIINEKIIQSSCLSNGEWGEIEIWGRKYPLLSGDLKQLRNDTFCIYQVNYECLGNGQKKSLQMGQAYKWFIWDLYVMKNYICCTIVGSWDKYIGWTVSTRNWIVLHGQCPEYMKGYVWQLCYVYVCNALWFPIILRGL